MVDALRVEYVDLATLVRWPRNPKQHDVGAIDGSISAFGFRDPIAVNKANGQIEEGHGRLDALQARKVQGRPAPDFIRVDGDRWLVPVLFFNDDYQTQERYALAHNRLQELGGGYDEDRQVEVLKDLAALKLLDGTGFDGDDVDRLERSVRFLSQTTAVVQRDQETRECPVCHATVAAIRSDGTPRTTCAECHAPLAEPGSVAIGPPPGSVTLSFPMLEDQRDEVMEVLKDIKARRLGPEATNTQALLWLVQHYES